MIDAVVESVAPQGGNAKDRFETGFRRFGGALCFLTGS